MDFEAPGLYAMTRAREPAVTDHIVTTRNRPSVSAC